MAAFDEIRKKFILLTPEEWVRLHTVQYLISEKNYPKSLINVEKQLKLGKRIKRYDVVVYKPSGEIHIIVECKAPSVKITQDTFDQIARYNMSLKANYLMVTNGLDHFYSMLDYELEQFKFLPSLPSYAE